MNQQPQYHKPPSRRFTLVQGIFLGLFAGIMVSCVFFGMVVPILRGWSKSEVASPTPSIAVPQQAQSPTASPSQPPAPTAAYLASEIELISVRVVDFTNPQGETRPMVIVKWRNNSNSPIYSVSASFKSRTRDYSTDSVDEYCIFVTQDRPIPPGGVYEDPPGNGFIVTSLPGDVLEDVRVRIVKASSTPPVIR